jgi:nucleoside-diphosphate-sugar epimerase
MTTYPEYIKDENALENVLSEPTPELIALMKKITGDIIFLGVAGKMGISMARMAKRACAEAGVSKKIIGVARFTSVKARELLDKSGIETIKGDLLDIDFLNSLPDVENVVYLAGMKFGATGNEPYTWAMNVFLPGLVVEKFKKSRIVALSTGSVYSFTEIEAAWSKESDLFESVGEYAQSCLGRERLFEYGSTAYGISTALVRLAYAVEMRYGVLVDIAQKVYNGNVVDLTMGYANVIWQGDANTQILRLLEFCENPAAIYNVTGPELVSIRETALEFGRLFNRKVVFTGREAETALLLDSSKVWKLMGKPRVKLKQIIQWTAHWIKDGKPLLGRPTHYEVRDGKF